MMKTVEDAINSIKRRGRVKHFSPTEVERLRADFIRRVGENEFSSLKVAFATFAAEEMCSVQTVQHAIRGTGPYKAKKLGALVGADKGMKLMSLTGIGGK